MEGPPRVVPVPLPPKAIRRAARQRKVRRQRSNPCNSHTSESVGCDNLPPDFMGGCDPLLVITAYQGGGVLMLEE
jgi:hypothetical protein